MSWCDSYPYLQALSLAADYGIMRKEGYKSINGRTYRSTNRTKEALCNTLVNIARAENTANEIDINTELPRRARSPYRRSPSVVHKTGTKRARSKSADRIGGSMHKKDSKNKRRERNVHKTKRARSKSVDRIGRSMDRKDSENERRERNDALEELVRLRDNAKRLKTNKNDMKVEYNDDDDDGFVSGNNDEDDDELHVYPRGRKQRINIEDE
jgi:hypothetical protein